MCKKMCKEFMDFLTEYKVIGLAIAFIIGAAAKELIGSFVDNIVMPFISPLLPSGAWQTATVTLGPFVFGIGAFIGQVINFVIIAFVVFMLAKMILNEEKVAKK